MASHPHRYPELASYRDPTQLANRRWPPVYLFDIQARMAYAIKIFHVLPWVPETFLARFPVFCRGFGLQPKMCQPSVNTENSHRTAEKPRPMPSPLTIW